MEASSFSTSALLDEAHERELDHMIRKAGWYPGSRLDWESLSIGERQDLAFKATGCQVAYATWPAPVDCLHMQCLIRRGKLPHIAQLNSSLRAERSQGWLRFISDRSRVARIFRYYRKLARERGVYDPWALDWQTMVSAGIEI